MALTLSACSSTSEEAVVETTAAADCTPDSLATLTPGTLTIATGEPAYEPWVLNDKPEAGEGFEAAVAYAVAKQLGYDNAKVSWVRTTFDSAIAAGPKTLISIFSNTQLPKTVQRLLISRALTTNQINQLCLSKEAKLMA